MDTVRVGTLTAGSMFVMPLTRRRGRVLEVGMLPGGGVPVLMEAPSLGRLAARDLHPQVLVEVQPEVE